MENEEELVIYGVRDALESAQIKAAAGDYSGAKEVLEEVIAKAEADKSYNDESVEYHTFAEPIEQVLFLNEFDNSKAFRISPEPFASLYLTYGSLLMGMSDWDGAGAALQKAIKWNPINPNLRLEYAEVLRAKEDMEGFFEATVETFKTAYNRLYIGRCYRNLGYYFVEKEKWNEAFACYVMSLHYDSKSEDAPKEMEYIQEKSGGNAAAPTIDDFNNMAQDYEFPAGADDKIVGIAAYYGHQALDDGRKDVAQYFLTIAYNLTGDTAVKEILDGIAEESDEK